MKKRNAILCFLACTILVGLLVLHTEHRQGGLPPGASGEPAPTLTGGVPAHDVPNREPRERSGPEAISAPGPTSISELGGGDSTSYTQRLLAEWQAPIAFYGRVVDENGNAVSGASIQFSWSHTPFEGGERTAATESDSEGLFSLLGRSGHSLEVRVQKPGFYTPRPGFESFKYSVDGSFLPDRFNPVVFRLRSKSQAEPLIHVAGIGLRAMRDFSLVDGGKPIGVSLHSGRQMAAEQGDLQVEYWAGRPLDGANWKLTWKCLVTVPGGGLVQTDEEFPFLAPLDGYRPCDEVTVTATNWTDKVERQYYVKLRDGNYGRATLRIRSGSNPFFRMESFLNPSGSRNLEYDPGKVVLLDN